MSGVMARSSDCTDLYKEAKKYLGASQGTLAKFETALLDLVQTRARQESLLAPTNVGRLKTLHDTELLFAELRATLGAMRALENRFLDVAKEEKACKKTLFYRTRFCFLSLKHDIALDWENEALKFISLPYVFQLKYK